MSDSSAFRSAIEAEDPAALEAALHPEVVFHSPAVFAPYEGRDAVMVLLRAVLDVFEDFRYTGAVREGSEEVLRFAARVGDRELEGVDLVSYDADGLVRELTVMIRPRQGLQAVLEAMGAQAQRLTPPRGASLRVVAPSDRYAITFRHDRAYCRLAARTHQQRAASGRGCRPRSHPALVCGRAATPRARGRLRRRPPGSV